MQDGTVVIDKQWKKEQASRSCTADVCLRQSVSQLSNNQKTDKLVLFSTACRLRLFHPASIRDNASDTGQREIYVERRWDEARIGGLGASVCTDRESRGDDENEGVRVAGPKTGPDDAAADDVGSSEAFRSFFSRDTA